VRGCGWCEAVSLLFFIVAPAKAGGHGRAWRICGFSAHSQAPMVGPGLRRDDGPEVAHFDLAMRRISHAHGSHRDTMRA
jgi:hypothetical protein